MGAGSVEIPDDEGEEWERDVGALLDSVDGLANDMSVAAYLERFGTDPRWSEAADAVRWMTEGFDAADPDDASIQAFAEEWRGEASIRGSGRRPACGYGPIAAYMHRSLDPETVRTLLGARVERITRLTESVRVDGTTQGARFSYSARAAIVTLPLSVLQAGTVAFSPLLPREKEEALHLLAMGSVYKVAMVFREPVWERSPMGNAAFFHDGNAAFPSLWTMRPTRSNLLIAWAGGRHGQHLAGCTRDEIIGRALASGESMLGVDLDETLEAAYFHDWQADPCALGAYSYVKVGGMKARRALAQPVDGRLLFAGEATALHGYAGTVAGAFDSGARAAEEAVHVVGT
jgi:hypothetical protein